LAGEYSPIQCTVQAQKPEPAFPGDRARRSCKDTRSTEVEARGWSNPLNQDCHEESCLIDYINVKKAWKGKMMLMYKTAIIYYSKM